MNIIVNNDLTQANNKIIFFILDNFNKKVFSHAPFKKLVIYFRCYLKKSTILLNF